uniref:Uncharacterized protein n=1 Tax=Chromera velia CCMP2878 TaxID=1169474 RepID=A0A0G4G9D0_9ALVE|eukprot:Cvel_20851.t1-p1 / transcript=Cvel_20851.t1 / gene=Cvel_20851 / organism=Chromera_velia_CCMP2878 / gene_product=hypothetical protein / transcript_product=hypothetical protein / location=Cvel_scaffold1910:21894-22572(+) / protein_length=186 / sequence_SO=supercontig / SO=protein_coding / is_pseudo=false
MEAKEMLKRRMKLLEAEMTEWTVRDTIERVEKMGLGEELRKIERRRTKKEHAGKAPSESNVLRRNKFWVLSEEGEEMEGGTPNYETTCGAPNELHTLLKKLCRNFHSSAPNSRDSFSSANWLSRPKRREEKLTGDPELMQGGGSGTALRGAVPIQSDVKASAQRRTGQLRTEKGPIHLQGRRKETK